MKVSKSRSRSEIESWLIKELAQALGVPEAQVDPKRNFLDLGLSSRTIVGISGHLQKWMAVRLPPTLLFEYPDIHSLAEHLSGEEPSKA